MRFLLPLVLLLAACSPVANVDADDGDPVALSVSLYVVQASRDTSSPLSSDRTTDELAEVFTRMRAIRDEVGVDLNLATVETITAPESVLMDLVSGTTNSFFDAAAAGVIAIPEPGAIVGFYVKAIGSGNGMTPLGTRVIFVADEPSVNDERVTSHEIGHILGLSHTLEDSTRLMFSCTNGTEVTEEEATVARYGASAILTGVR